jgi:hypothetical protein
MPPFELALTRPPPTTAIQALPREEELTPLNQKQEFLERLKTLRLRADGQLSAAQTRYKHTYDRGVKTKNAQIGEGDDAYVRMEVPEVGRTHKLYPLVHGSYRVIENAGNTFRLQIGPDVVRASSDRISRAPKVREAKEHLDEGVRDTRRGGTSNVQMGKSPPKGVHIRSQGRGHPSRESGKTINRR